MSDSPESATLGVTIIPVAPDPPSEPRGLPLTRFSLSWVLGCEKSFCAKWVYFRSRFRQNMDHFSPQKDGTPSAYTRNDGVTVIAVQLHLVFGLPKFRASPEEVWAALWASLHRWLASRGPKWSDRRRDFRLRSDRGSPLVRFSARFSARASVFERYFAKYKPRRGVCFHIRFREKRVKGNLEL